MAVAITRSPKRSLQTAEALIAREDHRVPLIAPVASWKKRLASLAVDGQVPDLVDDEQPGSSSVTERWG
jgi:hypothetical protein